MNIDRCRHFRDLCTTHCAARVQLAKVRDRRGRIPCVACGPLAQPARDVRCKLRDLPTEAEVDAWAFGIQQQAAALSRSPLDNEEPPL